MERRFKNILEICLIITTIVILLISILINKYRISVIFASSIHLCYGSILYFRHGGKNITCLGVFSISSVAFLALPAIYLWIIQNLNFTVYHSIASVLSFISLIVINIIV